MGGKDQLLAAGSNETAHHLSPLSLALCYVKPSPQVRRVFSLKFISTKFILKIEEIGHEDTMMGSHPGGRVTACIVRCLILEYLMEMVVIFISPLGSVRRVFSLKFISTKFILKLEEIGSLSKPVTHDSFVMQVGVVCDPVQSDSTTHDHSDALIPPVSQVYPAYAETYKNHSRTSPIVLHLFQA
ncbi:hypothetical protein F2Q70_00036011 [Brassica cretica]|uniref:Uncharacterized protein n=1 Tax=Brassica cretica TaxID=69181 RepID=A0A8S9JXW9_BRACR|nr:hypothetical protein F2Q70_00036011 [Brassica cretica]